MNYKISYIGTLAIGVEEPGGPVLSFTLPVEDCVPEEFKIGDEVEITNHPSHPAMIAFGHVTGFYEITHIASGKVLKVFHKDDDWKVK